MHLRRLSSSTTPLFKFVWPVGFLGPIGYFLAKSLLGLGVRWGPGITPFWGNVILAGLLLGGLAVLATMSIPLKRVDYDGESLHISNYVSTDPVAVNQVSAVTVYGEFRHNERPTVKIRFRDRTRFGRQIVFIAESPELLDDFCRSLGPDVTVRR
jgi:hypothetical protein